MNIWVKGSHLKSQVLSFAVSGAMIVALAGCDENGNFQMLSNRSGGPAGGDGPTRSVKLVEHDVEAPEIFQVEDLGLWDGRPSLGGVWVAHPAVKDPERVIIRNSANDKFVIGALFRRERETPGPALQVSSDAAAALGMLAGQPSSLNVTALRREETPQAPQTDEIAPAESLPASDDVQQTALDPVKTAAAAIDAAEASAKPETPTPRPWTGKLEKPYIQIGIFSIETNARNTAEAMRTAGMVPLVKKQTSKGKTFWRVLVGPATSTTERSVLLKKIREKGFEDAYPVTN